MINEEIVARLKAEYPRDLRKHMIKNILLHEKSRDKAAIDSSYKILNQIFSYIISELNWKIAEHTSTWDQTPLKVIAQAFPKLSTTQWYKEQQINISNSTK